MVACRKPVQALEPGKSRMLCLFQHGKEFTPHWGVIGRKLRRQGTGKFQEFFHGSIR
jgi:hypothetical protein